MSYFINIIKENIPYQFDIRLSKTTYTFEVNYNADHDFFTVALSDSRGIIYTVGEKLVLNKPILSGHAYLNFPLVKPIDPTGQAKQITWGNFNKTVFLYVGGSSE